MMVLFSFLMLLLLPSDKLEKNQNVILKSAETTVEQKGIRRVASSSVVTKTSKEKIWKILTSYDNMDEFLPSVNKSKLISRSGNKVVVDYSLNIAWQELRFIQECTELNNNQFLTFKTIDGDLKNYEGSWSLSETPEGTIIKYFVSVDYDSVLPDWMINQLMKSGITYLIELIAVKASEV